jgi:hypothetical protein
MLARLQSLLRSLTAAADGGGSDLDMRFSSKTPQHSGSV